MVQDHDHLLDGAVARWERREHVSQFGLGVGGVGNRDRQRRSPQLGGQADRVVVRQLHVAGHDDERWDARAGDRGEFGGDAVTGIGPVRGGGGVLVPPVLAEPLVVLGEAVLEVGGGRRLPVTRLDDPPRPAQ